MEFDLQAKSTMSWIEAVSNMPRAFKKFIQVVFDVTSLSVSYALSAYLVADIGYGESHILLGFLFVSISIVVLYLAKIYRIVVRFSGFDLMTMVTSCQLITVLILTLTSSFLDSQLTLVNSVLLFFTSLFLLGGGRFLARKILDVSFVKGERTLIYGVGKIAVQLMASLRRESGYYVVAFVDDSCALRGFELHGTPVFSSDELEDKIYAERISTVILANRDEVVSNNRSLLSRLESLPVVVKSAPSVADLLEDQSNGANYLKDLRVEDIVGRESVHADRRLLKRNIYNKVVLVTGAGGSIGSEICRQVVSLSPKRLILLELSELALFNIYEELEKRQINITTVLGSVCDKLLIEDLLVSQKVQTVYHAAAYKHVPLVESNPFVGIYNNVFGTQTILEASIRAHVKSFTLISTDKAVRPTNIMGASKRISEILCQLAAAKESKTKVSIVRFGNVIGSSGSVIPKFREQIRYGGPVTVTHPEITRFFMGIPEASELVLQASSLAEGGDVFVLDMGEPVKIAALAEKLIRFSGKIVETNDNAGPNTIKIVFTGLRPGEKLYEELLISGEAFSTAHPKIMKMNEKYPDEDLFLVFLENLRSLLKDKKISALKSLLGDVDIGYTNPDESSISEVNKDENNQRAECIVPSQSSIVTPLPEHLDLKDLSAKSENKLESNNLISRTIRFLRRRIFINALHKYFLLTRGLTVGVRCVVLNDSDEVLLVRHTYTSGWHLPGGGINLGESAEEAVKREVFEETSCMLEGQPELMGITQCKETSRRDHIALFYSDRFLVKKTTLRSFEISDCQFYPINNLPEDIDKMTSNWLSSVLRQRLENQDALLV